jgi:hypothetical protein
MGEPVGNRRRPSTVDSYDRGMPRAGLSLLAACILALPGCGGDDSDGVPGACANGADAFRAALRAAPGPVRVDGVALSDCLSDTSEPENLQLVGGFFVEVAAGLADEARQRPSGRAVLELGYLVGAVRRGASDTQGVHYELLRRLDQELGPLDTRTSAFRRGLRAGRRAG